MEMFLTPQRRNWALACLHARLQADVICLLLEQTTGVGTSWETAAII